MFKHRREGDVSGVWETDYGLMRLEQMGAAVRGSYTSGGGSTLEGTLSGNTLTLAWNEGTGATGTATFTFHTAMDVYWLLEAEEWQWRRLERA